MQQNIMLSAKMRLFLESDQRESNTEEYFLWFLESLKVFILIFRLKNLIIV